MSDNQEPESDEKEESEAGAEAATEAPAESGNVDEPAPARSSGGGFVAWLALLLALAAVVGVGADFVRTRNSTDSAATAAAAVADSEARLQELTASIGATQEAMLALEDRLGALSSADSGQSAAISEHDAAIDRLTRDLTERLQGIEGVPGRLSTLEATMASLQGVSTGARDAWLLAEAEYYLQIANVQLQLADDPDLAMLALNHADERIVQVGDPRLTSVRQALSDEKRAIENMDKRDTAGITLTLASLADSVDTLPLRRGQQAVAAVDPVTGEIDPSLTGMDRAMASVRSALDGVVSVRDSDEVEKPFIAPEAQYFLRTNLALQLQAARLALLRGEDEVFRESLDDADDWLAEYYDDSSAAVRSARETLADIRESVFQIAVPDISGSLRLLRQFNALAEAAESGQQR